MECTTLTTSVYAKLWSVTQTCALTTNKWSVLQYQGDDHKVYAWRLTVSEYLVTDCWEPPDRERRKKSAIAEHAWGQQHSILWEETSMLDQAKNNTTLLIKEALHICLTDLELINRDEGVAIPECCHPVLDHATMTSSTHATPHRETVDETIDAT